MLAKSDIDFEYEITIVYERNLTFSSGLPAGAHVLLRFMRFSDCEKSLSFPYLSFLQASFQRHFMEINTQSLSRMVIMEPKR